MRWLAFPLVCVVGCGGDLGPLPTRVDCAGASPGEACPTDGAWCASSDVCGADVRYCRCTDGAYECTAPYTAAEIATCTVVAEAFCFREGTGVCDREPRGGGSCGCANGTWSCADPCDGCPSSVPADGETCTGAGTCRYAGPPSVTCTCSGTFTCSPS